MKKLGLGGGLIFQWPLLENLNSFYKMHFFSLDLLLAFFSFMFTNVGCCVCCVF